MDNASTYVGLDAHKNTIAVAMLVSGEAAPIQWQEATTTEAIRRLVRRLLRARADGVSRPRAERALQWNE